MNATVLAEQEPALTPPPSPAKPPEIPGGDRYTALCWIMGGKTSAGAAAYFAHLARSSPEGVSAVDAARRARLVAAMAELEAQKCTPEMARAALSLPEPRKPAAA